MPSLTHSGSSYKVNNPVGTAAPVAPSTGGNMNSPSNRSPSGAAAPAVHLSPSGSSQRLVEPHLGGSSSMAAINLGPAASPPLPALPHTGLGAPVAGSAAPGSPTMGAVAGNMTASTPSFRANVHSTLSGTPSGNVDALACCKAFVCGRTASYTDHGSCCYHVLRLHLARASCAA